jgi:cyclopropane fatty-acyl-phospholipid synthase-like methyltransferase
METKMTSRSWFINFLVALLYALLWSAPVTAQTFHTHQHSFEGAEQWAKMFDDPERDAWQKPHEVIQALALKPDAVVTDIGAGTGYFSVRLSHMVPKGRIYGVDIEPDMVKYLANRAKQNGLTNLIAVQAVPDDPRLPEKVDLMIIVDTYHHIEGRDRYLRKLHNYLKPEGRIAIIDYRMDSPDGPPKSARSTPEAIEAELIEAGYVLVQKHDFLPKQYFLVFQLAKK